MSPKAKDVTPEAQRRELRLFVEIPGYDEVASYAGEADDVRRVAINIGCHVMDAIENLICDQNRQVVVRITSKRMTDEEVANLPEV